MATEHSIAETKPVREISQTSCRFPREFWQEVKIEAVRRRTSAQQLLMDATREFLKPVEEKRRKGAK